MVGVIQRGIDPVGAGGSDVGALFKGLIARDRLPASPHRQGPKAYVFNTDPHGRPGQHWLALWTPGDDTCEIMDCFGLPFEQYGSRPLEAWLARHWKAVDTNRASLQALTSWTCGHYVLMYLMLKRSRRDLDAVFEPLQSSRLRAKRPSCQSVVETTNPNP